MKNAGILTDLTKCIGCEACVEACKEINGLPLDDDKAAKLTATSWTIIEKRGGVFVRRHCLHCLEPTCVSVCPVTALERTETGAVIYHEDRCIGCRYCILACPFEIPTYEWDKNLPKVQKCVLCFDKRLSKGEPPACTSVCPTGATLFGDRDELLLLAQRRIDEKPDRYVSHIYGEKEAGGTSVLYLSDLPFEGLGFKKARTDLSYPKLTWSILSKIPNIVILGGVLMWGIWWIINRRVTLEESGEEKKR